MTDEELEAAMDAVEAGTLHEPSGLLLALVAEVRRLRKFESFFVSQFGEPRDADYIASHAEEFLTEVRRVRGHR